MSYGRSYTAAGLDWNGALLTPITADGEDVNVVAGKYSGAAFNASLAGSKREPGFVGSFAPTAPPGIG